MGSLRQAGYPQAYSQSKRGGHLMELSEFQEKLIRIVGREKFEKALSKYLSQLRQTTKITIHQKNLEDLEERYWQGFSDNYRELGRNRHDVS